jgi:hypothetical protein
MRCPDVELEACPATSVNVNASDGPQSETRMHRTLSRRRRGVCGPCRPRPIVPVSIALTVFPSCLPNIGSVMIPTTIASARPLTFFPLADHDEVDDARRWEFETGTTCRHMRGDVVFSVPGSRAARLLRCLRPGQRLHRRLPRRHGRPVREARLGGALKDSVRPAAESLKRACESGGTRR